MSSPAALAVIALPIGACAGSYVATASIRSLRAEQALTGRSHCDHCGSGLSFLQTLPIVSYAGLRGVCSRCGGPIDRTHLAGEAAGGVAFSAPLLLLPWPVALVVTALGLILLALSVMDAKTGRLPDILTASAGLICVPLALRSGMTSLGVGLGCAVATVLLLSAVRFGFAKVKGEPGLGFGDVKLLGVLAIWVGPGIPWVLATAGALGLGFVGLVRPKGRLIPFGPFVALAAWIIGLGREAHWWLVPS